MANEGINENTKISGTLFKSIVIFVAVAVQLVAAGILWANLQRDLKDLDEGKADKSTVERYITADSVNTRTLFQMMRDLNRKTDKLLQKENIKINPKDYFGDEDN